MKYEDKLKPCPFCGGTANIAKGRIEFWDYCPHCGARTEFYETEREAVDAWNARPIEDEKDKENKRLRKALEHAVTTDTTVDKWGIWRIDGKTFQTWASDVLKGNEK